MTSRKNVDLSFFAQLTVLACVWIFSLCATAAAPSETNTRTFELVVPAGATAVEPRVLRTNDNDRVRLRVTSTVAGEVHLHAYKLHVKVTPGVPAELNFTAHPTGRFRIEWHGEAGTPGDHHAPPLATLEVWPR